MLRDWLHSTASFKCFFIASMLGFHHRSTNLFGLSGTAVHVTIGEIARSVFIYLGIPFIAGILTRLILVKIKGKEWYHHDFIPKISPITLTALLFTIVVMFSLRENLSLNSAERGTDRHPIVYLFCGDVSGEFPDGESCRCGLQENCYFIFTAASNNFELAIAVAVAVFGISSGQAFMAVIGPLVEVPVMIGLVNVAYSLKKRLFAEE